MQPVVGFFHGMANSLQLEVMARTPRLLGALLILIAGWVVAALLGMGIARVSIVARVDAGLDRLGLDGLLKDQKGQRVPAARILGKAAYYLGLTFVVVAFLEALNLSIVAGPINAMLSKLLAAVPDIIAALVILAAAWGIGYVLKVVVTQGLDAIRFDERAVEYGLTPPSKEGEASRRLGIQIGNAVFYLTLLFFLPAFLGALHLTAMVVPFQGLVTRLFQVLPALLGAAVTFAVGWLVARVVRQISARGLAALGLDAAVERTGVQSFIGPRPLSSIAGTVLYYLILLAAIVTALNTLELHPVSQPITAMLTTVVAYLPRMVSAAFVVAVGLVLARVIRELVTNLLAGVAFDGFLARIGLVRPETAGPSASRIIGTIAMAIVILLVAGEGLEILNLVVLSRLLERLLLFLPHLAIATLILGAGVAIATYLQGLVRTAIERTHGGGAEVIAGTTKYAVLVLAAVMALEQLGVARQIVVIGFGLSFGAICLALALAFGLGARDTAGDYIRRMVSGGEQR